MAQLSWEAVAGYAYAAGLRGEPLAIATAITQPESGRNPGNHNPNAATGDNSYGLWQINMLGSLGPARRAQFGLASNEQLFDPATNARAMYAISSGGTNFRPWTTFKNNKHLPYMADARAAAQAVERRGGPPADTTTPTATDGTTTPAPVTTSADVVAELNQIDLNWRPSSTIAGFKLVGRSITIDDGPLAQSLISANLHLTADQVSQITMSFAAPEDFGISKYLLLGAFFDWHDLHLEIAERSLTDQSGPAVLTTNLRSVGVQKLTLPAWRRRTWQNTSPTEVLNEVVTAAGLRFLGKGTVRRAEIANPPDEDATFTTTSTTNESEWEMGKRFANEEGFWFFETAGLVVFGPPTWLADRMPRYRLEWRSKDPAKRILRLLEAHESMDAWREAGKLNRTISVEVPAAIGQQIRPGMVCDFAGDASWAGAYITTQISAPLGGDQPVTVDASTPIDPIPAGVPETDTSGPLGVISDADVTQGGAVRQEGRISALDFVTVCLEQVGTPYVFGAEANVADEDPNAFDCSELVEWALRRCGHVMPGHEHQAYGPGVFFPDGAYNQWKASAAITVEQARVTRGALLFVGDGIGTGRDAITHVAVSLGSGNRTIEARGRAYGVTEAPIDNRFNFAGLVPGLAYA